MPLKPTERSQLLVFAAIIITLHVVGWGLTWLAVAQYPFMVGFAALA